jgi:hypothetical protein
LAAPDGVHVIGKAGRLGGLVDDPSNAAGFDFAKIGHVVVMRQVNHQRVDRHRLQFAATFHGPM